MRFKVCFVFLVLPLCAAARQSAPVSKQETRNPAQGESAPDKAGPAGKVPSDASQNEQASTTTASEANQADAAPKNSFDYSSFVFVGLTSMIAEGSNAHPQLGKGVAGYGRYYWRGFLDKTDGNYMVIAVLPTLLHEDERYFAMGHAGGFWKRLIYSGSRVAIARNYEGANTPNISELLGRGIAQGVSISYYPSRSRTAGAIATKYGYAILRDAATNIFREFWPDIATHVLHRHP